MKHLWAAIVLSVATSGCAHYQPSIPAGYTGPKANIEDTRKYYSGSHVDLFYLTHVDGMEIDNARFKTLRENRGRGFSMSAITATNPIPARPVVLTLNARTMYGAPILELANAIYQVNGEVSFTPEADKRYLVKGVLGEDYSAVWLEESDTQAVVGKKIEAIGSAKLGILQK
jgi:hypothetical protein